MDEKLNNSAVQCPLCFSQNSTNFFYPPTTFNEKVYSYFTCLNCHSSFVHPFPLKEDYDKIYGENDHTYLKSLKPNEKYIHNLNLPLYNHQRYQLQFFKSGEYWKGRKSLLDIGCGSGFYMRNASNYGMQATGIEYDESFANLMSEKTGLNIFSFADFEKKFDNQKFDIIHFGHILEHLEMPSDILNWAGKYAHPDTLFIIDGPLEKNYSLATFIISMGSKIKKRKMNYYPPQHLSFTSRKSQLKFFEINQFKTIRYKTAEQLFPLPPKPDWKSIPNFSMYVLGIFSVVFTHLIPGWGNVFHYAGIRK